MSGTDMERGIILSAVYLVETADQPTYAQDLLKAYGIDLKRVLEIADEADMAAITKLSFKCPECKAILEFDGGSHGNSEEPPTPAVFFCECGYELGVE